MIEAALGDLDPATWWLLAALLLGAAELLVPGVFLVFLAAAAAVTAVVAWLVPGIGTIGELICFTACSIAAVAAGRRWYREHPVASLDPLLNDRTARLVGQIVTVAEAIDAGQGRVRVGDSEWSARGPDAPVGAHVRIAGADGTTLLVEPLASPETALP